VPFYLLILKESWAINLYGKNPMIAKKVIISKISFSHPKKFYQISIPKFEKNTSKAFRNSQIILI